MDQAHGGNLFLASETYGPKSFLDFSANINPLGVPKPVMRAIQSSIASGALEHYPDPGCTALTRALSARHGIAPERIICGNGVSELLNIALSILPQGSVAIHAPAFGEYAAAARQLGHTPEFLELERETWTPSLCAKHFIGVILGNPNNPTSRALPEKTLISFLERCDWVVLDEAFVELCVPGTAQSMLHLQERYPNLIVLRAFTKSIAIPGLRLGYAIAIPDTIAAMRRAQIPWSVNALAQSVAGALSELSDYEGRTRKWLSIEPRWLYERLREIPGVTAWPPDTNFILCRLDRGSARELAQVMARRGILIRVAANFESLDESFFRVGVKFRKENELLVKELGEVCSLR